MKIRLSYVHEYRDRHGKVRRYVRRRGRKTAALPGNPGSAEFMAAYEAAIGGAPTPSRPTHASGTLNALAASFFRSTEFANLRPSSQKSYRLMLEPVLRQDGHRLVRDLPLAKARKVIEEIGATRPGTANLTRKILGRLFSYAIDLELRTDNPFTRVPRYKLGTHHTWTDAEIGQFERKWPLGTRERLAFALLLYTGQRVGDVAKMRRSDIRNGVIRVVQTKTAKSDDEEMLIAVHPALARALRAGPVKGLALVGDPAGRAISGAHLSVMMRAAAATAGLPSKCVPHGLRKAALRRLAEHGSTTKEIAAVSGHRSLTEIERYTQRADQARLAKAAMRKLPDKH